MIDFPLATIVNPVYMTNNGRNYVFNIYEENSNNIFVIDLKKTVKKAHCTITLDNDVKCAIKLCGYTDLEDDDATVRIPLEISVLKHLKGGENDSFINYDFDVDFPVVNNESPDFLIILFENRYGTVRDEVECTFDILIDEFGGAPSDDYFRIMNYEGEA